MTTRITSTERDPQTSAVIAAAIEVHRTLGRGFFEYVYRTPLEMELLERGIPFRREVSFPVLYKGRPTGLVFRVDLVCHGEVIVELKAMTELTGAARAQTINYLRASGLERALLLNFGAPVLGIERFINHARDGTVNVPRAERRPGDSQIGVSSVVNRKQSLGGRPEKKEFCVFCAFCGS